ncbi:uncharacterized protein si:ch211-127m7.2 [Pseudorasbora parva]|uniref:uncharacterized protein si:ch211-127m7.2 n=1 Tax=Pseudorasbora parva TaxID=51549 RepID=UPI00351E9315
MSEKPRNLPLWMVKSDVKCSKYTEVEKKKSHETTKRRAKNRRRVVTYWMNERELVETALSILKDDKSCARDEMQSQEEEVKIIPETDEDTSDEQDRICVSNIAEQETVPYGHCMEESTSTKLECQLKTSPVASGILEKPSVHDDALELVREIFFT